MNTVRIIVFLFSAILFATIQPAAADGVTAWCGNGCSSDPDTSSGVSCTDWGKATGSSVCQAKAICSEECTVWVAEFNRNIDLFFVESEKDLKRIRKKMKGGLGVGIVAKDKLLQNTKKKAKEKSKNP